MREARKPLTGGWIILGPAMAAAACTSYPKLQTAPRALEDADSLVRERSVRNQREAVRQLENPAVERLPNPSTPAPRSPARLKTPEAAPADIDAVVSDDEIEVTLPPQPVPNFIDTVFGEVLQVPYTMGPGVAERKDIVSLRGSVAVSKRKFFLMTQTALRDYGLAVSIDNGAVRIISDEVLSKQTPIFIRARSLPETPEGSRPVIQFFELKSIDVNSLIELLKDSFPDIGKVKLTARQDINTLVISGNVKEVSAIADVVDQIDRPRFAGADIARVEPVFWSAERLADAVVQVLNTEGFQAARGAASIQRAVTFLPVPFTNQVLLFSNQKDAFERALFWINELDRPAALGDQDSVFIYTVQNTSAEELGRLVAQVSPDTAGGTAGQVPAGGRRLDTRTTVPGTAPSSDDAGRSDAGPSTLGRITIDPVGNRLLFRGTPSEFERVRELMLQLDTPPRQVLVELTIAEVTLTDETRFGVEWFITEAIEQGFISGTTLGGLGLAAGGLDLTVARMFSGGEVRAALNAFASNNNVNILSTPRLVARSGGEAQIQVGTDVPIITSQRALDVQTGGDSDILQTVQYRQTGVILNVRPIAYGDDRIDVEIFQEVSSQQSNPNAAIASPLILNRSVTTQLSLREGATAVIGGLIQDNYTRGQTGIPVLKDLPLIGTAFRSDTVSGSKTELLILVTPYVVRDDAELAQAADTYSASINRRLRSRGPHAYTLLPWRTGIRPSQVHGRTQPFERRERLEQTPSDEPVTNDSDTDPVSVLLPGVVAPLTLVAGGPVLPEIAGLPSTEQEAIAPPQVSGVRVQASATPVEVNGATRMAEASQASVQGADEQAKSPAAKTASAPTTSFRSATSAHALPPTQSLAASAAPEPVGTLQTILQALRVSSETGRLQAEDLAVLQAELQRLRSDAPVDEPERALLYSAGTVP